MKAPKPEKLWDLERFQEQLIDDKPVYVKVQTHLYKKSYAFCKFTKNTLEGFSKWPAKTFFKIVENVPVVSNPQATVGHFAQISTTQQKAA